MQYVNYNHYKYSRMQSQGKIELKQCNINNFRFKTKAVIYTGPCEITREESRFAVNSKQCSLTFPFELGLIRMSQLHYSTYLYTYQDTVYSLSIPIDHPQYKSIFQSFISQSSKIIDFYSLPPDSDVRNIIATNCLLGPQAEQLGSNNSDNLHHAGKAVGSIFGTVSAIFQFDEINKDTRNTINRLQQNNLGTGQNSGWGRFKNKCSVLNKKMTQALQPVSQTCKKTKDDFGNKFNNSNNSIIKGVRQWSKKTSDALNEGYLQGENVGDKNRRSLPN